MLTTYVARGVKAGLVAGFAFGLLVALVANPLVAFADERGHAGGHGVGDHHGEATDSHHAEATGGHHAEEPAVPAAVTDAVSVVSGVLWGVLLGAVVFGFAYYFLEPLIPGAGGVQSYVLAAAGFVTVSGAPWLVLPPQPPGVEQTLPTSTRLLLYGGMMVAGAGACAAAGYAYGRLRDERGRAVAAAASALPLGLLAVPALFSPVNASSSPLDPELAAGLTGVVVVGQMALWVLLAGTHAWLRRRAGDETPAGIEASPSETGVAAD